MKDLRSLALAAALVCAGLTSTAQAAPLAVDATSLGQPAATETVQYGYGYRPRYGHSPQYRYRKHIRRQMLHERRYDAHLRRQDRNYRRAYRYGY
ncbi:hypothetical protein MBUL_01268 [Methylobacterium bullatum]|uniref:Uncharacterized protein n=1 Tax=Methylobacterium bullatum TaxID=570505 RepID=A0A679IRX4_9HYPH|nr:hypothetical protein MBUL_01268 [Methylobacterium bullatum]